MDIRTLNLANNAEVWGIMAQFGAAFDQISLAYLKEKGFGDGRTRSVGCLGWIWMQWLSKTPPAEIQRQVEPFVDRGMEMQTLSTKFEKRPLHDLLLLHCAIFSCGDARIKKLAERVVDSAGANGHHPRDDGELYASAWTGMLKHSILGDRAKAEAEAEIIWKAHKDIAFKASTKQLVAPWLKGDWDAFRKNQKKDFEKLWEQAKKHGAAQVNDRECVVNLDGYSSVQQSWCWAHCGLALLARRQGVEVATDPIWLPPHAIQCVDALK
jgi:hypothetical protein